MAGPTLAQVHIERAMTNISIAYRNTNYIADQVFPAVSVQKQSDKYFTYEKSDWLRNEAGLRAPGTRGPVIEYSLSSEVYACRPIAAAKIVPDEMVDNSDQPLNLRKEAVEFATDKVLLFAEYEVANKVLGAGTWSGSSTPSPNWSDDASDPCQTVDDARESVVSKIGREPNVMVIGREVWTDLKNHPDLLDKIKYTGTGRVTPQKLAELFEVEKLLIGNAIYDSAEEGATASLAYIWGKSAWLGYVPPNPGLMTPAAGYIMTWKNRTVERHRMPLEKADFYRVEWHYDDKVTCADAGYELKSVVD